jgi:succinate dehydrogenase/fumarate reductase flavoprotein subunit
MVNVITLETKVETTLVEASAVIVAAGTAGLVAVNSLPASLQVPASAVCATLISVGGSILAVWHKFVNVATTQIQTNTANAAQPTQAVPQ